MVRFVQFKEAQITAHCITLVYLMNRSQFANITYYFKYGAGIHD